MTNVDLGLPYFLMSFKYDKTTPIEFGLQQSTEDNNVYVSNSDGANWAKIDLYDFGWGNEIGFMRLPKLSFEQLFYLLEHSTLDSNKYGASHIILKDYSYDLLNYLLVKLNDSSFKVTRSLKKAFQILGLDQVKNRTPIIGKSQSEIQQDFEMWKFVTETLRDDALK